MLEGTSSGTDPTKAKVSSGVKKDMSMCDFLRKEKDTLVFTSGEHAPPQDDQTMTSSNDESPVVTSPITGSKRKATGVAKPAKRQKTGSSSAPAGKGTFIKEVIQVGGWVCTFVILRVGMSGSDLPGVIYVTSFSNISYCINCE